MEKRKRKKKGEGGWGRRGREKDKLGRRLKQQVKQTFSGKLNQSILGRRNDPVKSTASIPFDF